MLAYYPECIELVGQAQLQKAHIIHYILQRHSLSAVSRHVVLT
jgi:hypothetical protein